MPVVLVLTFQTDQIKDDVRSMRIGSSMRTTAAIILSLSYTITALDIGITRAIDCALMMARVFSMAAWTLVLFRQSLGSE